MKAVLLSIAVILAGCGGGGSGGPAQTPIAQATPEVTPIIDQETYLLPLVTPDLFGAMHDGIHPNQATYLLMGLYTNARLNQILGK